MARGGGGGGSDATSSDGPAPAPVGQNCEWRALLPFFVLNNHAN